MIMHALRLRAASFSSFSPAIAAAAVRCCCGDAAPRRRAVVRNVASIRVVAHPLRAICDRGRRYAGLLLYSARPSCSDRAWAHAFGFGFRSRPPASLCDRHSLAPGCHPLGLDRAIGWGTLAMALGGLTMVPHVLMPEAVGGIVCHDALSVSHGARCAGAGGPRLQPFPDRAGRRLVADRLRAAVGRAATGAWSASARRDAGVV